MKYLLLFLCLILPVSAQKIGDLTAITGANVDPAVDRIPILDVSANTVKKIAIGELLGIRAGWLDVRDYGAVGDGVTDDTAAFEACFAAGVANGVKTVYAPPGTYILEDCVVPAGFKIFGASGTNTAWEGVPIPNATTIFKPLNGTCDVFVIYQDAVSIIDGLGGTTFERLAIQYGTYAETPTPTSTGSGITLAVEGAITWVGANLLLDNVDIRNFARGLNNIGGANRIHIKDSCLAQCTIGLYSTGATGSMFVENCEIGGTSYDRADSKGFYLHNMKACTFAGVEFGNSDTAGEIEWSSVVQVVGGNAETFYGSHVFANRGALTLIGLSYNATSADNAPLVRSNHTFAGSRTTFINVEVRDGTTYYDSRFLLWETNRADDLPPVFVNTQGSARRMNAGFDTVLKRWSDRSLWQPFEVERRPLCWAGHGSTVASSGSTATGGDSLSLLSWGTAGSFAVANMSASNYIPILRRPAASDATVFNWSAPFEARFVLTRLALAGVLDGDSDWRIVFGSYFNVTTTAAPLAAAIAVEGSGTTVSLLVHNGTTPSTVVLGTVPEKAAGEIVIRYDGAGTLRGSINGGTEVELTGGPTGDAPAHCNNIVAAAWNTAGGNSILTYLSNLEIATPP